MSEHWTMWVFSSYWPPRQKNAMRRSDDAEESNIDPYRDYQSRDTSLSNDDCVPPRCSDVESGGGWQHYRDNSVDSSINGNSSGNTPILARTGRRSSLKPIITSYCVERSPIRLPSPARSRSRLCSCLPFTRKGTGPILTPDSPAPPDRSCWAFLRKSKRSYVFRWVIFLVFLFFIILGLLQFVALTLGVISAFFPDDVDRLVAFWGNGGEVTKRLSTWPTEYTRDIKPVRCHSHNDYWRLVPLYSALHAGCISVEADIWMFDRELFVGHSAWSLSQKRTLRDLYIDPLTEILDKQNPTTDFPSQKGQPLHGVFNTEPSQQLVLLIDFKNDGPAAWPHLKSQLTPLRDRGYLTYFNGTDIIPGPIIVVGTGNAPFDLLTSNSTYRDVFFDAPLDEFADDSQSNAIPSREIVSSRFGTQDEEGIENNSRDLSISSPSYEAPRETSTPNGTYNTQNSYYASVSFSKSIGSLWNYRFSSEQLELLRSQIRCAHKRGLKVRYWNLPSWPRLLRNHVWTVLVREGVDLLNADDLKGATMEDWVDKSGVWRGWFWW